MRLLPVLTRGSSVLIIALASLLMPISAARADIGDYGYQDGSYSGLPVSHPESATSDKPESKLWYAGGSWWTSMWIPSASEFHISRLDVQTQQWQDTGVVVDRRSDSDSDVLLNGTHLFIASHIRAADSANSSTGQNALLYRYSLAAGSWSLDGGFPVVISGSSAESMTIDIDSAGFLWATWTQKQKLMLARTKGTADAATVAWGGPFTPNLSGAGALASDDISAIVRSRNQTMVVWSNQRDAAMYYGVHQDNADQKSWRGGSAIKGQYTTDDHVNLKSLDSDQSGRVFAAVKTSADDSPSASPTDPLIRLLVFKPGTGSWSLFTYGTVADRHTRPIVMLDETNQQVHMFATGPSPNASYDGAGTIYEKTAPIDNPVFASGLGVPVIRDADSAFMNNATGSKQSVSSATGLVVLASNESTRRYWHSYEPLTATEPPAQTWSFAPVDDATIRGDLPDANYGSDARLGADASPQTNFLLKFTVSTGCGAIKDARLFITVGTTLYDEADYGGDLFATGTDWTESTLTWSTAPASGVALGSLTGPVAQNTTYSLPVTSAVRADGTVAFRIASSSTDGVKFFSKEGSASSGPRLEVAC